MESLAQVPQVNLGPIVAVVLSLGGIALGVTKAVDFVRDFAKEQWPEKETPSWAWIAMSWVFGLGVALGWQIDISTSILELIPAIAKNSTRLQGIAGQVLTGLTIGGIASFWHHKLDQWSSEAKWSRASADVAKVEVAKVEAETVQVEVETEAETKKPKGK